MGYISSSRHTAKGSTSGVGTGKRQPLETFTTRMRCHTTYQSSLGELVDVGDHVRAFLSLAWYPSGGCTSVFSPPILVASSRFACS